VIDAVLMHAMPSHLIGSVTVGVLRVFSAADLASKCAWSKDVFDAAENILLIYMRSAVYCRM